MTERAVGLKFSIQAEYSLAEFTTRCLDLIAQLSAGDGARNRLAEYVGWARNLGPHEKINWIILPDGSAVPYVMRGNVGIGPNGEEC